MKNFFRGWIILTILKVFCISCINREESEDESNPIIGEVTFDYSGALSGSFISDSTIVTIDDIGNSGLWIFSLNAYSESPQLINFGFTAIGIDFPGELNIDHSSNFGQGNLDFYFDSGIYNTNVIGAGGSVTVDEFMEQDHISGSFSFTLINTVIQDTINVTNGYFNAEIDSSLYINS